MLWAILVYAAALAAAGLYFGRRVHAAADFFVASRGLPAGLLFSTFLAANLGAGATVGVAQLGYQYGLAAWWWVGSAGIGSLLLAYFVGPRIWAVAAEHDLYTVGDYLELRYSRSVRLLLASFLWLGSLAILAGQLIAMGFILEVAAGLPRAWGCALGGVLVTLYFAAGGLWGRRVSTSSRSSSKALASALPCPGCYAKRAHSGRERRIRKLTSASSATPTPRLAGPSSSSPRSSFRRGCCRSCSAHATPQRSAAPSEPKASCCSATLSCPCCSVWRPARSIRISPTPGSRCRTC
ncbi:MAG: hypothetical protein R2724_26240 [Bryobacterales bacterium]